MVRSSRFSGTMQAACGLVAQRDRQHLLGRRHFEVQRQAISADQAVDVLVGDVAAVLAQMGGDAVGTGLGGEQAGAHGIGIAGAARVPDRRDMVDIDAEAERALLTRRRGFRA